MTEPLATEVPLKARDLPGYHTDLLRLARHLGLPPDRAEDAVQSCLLNVLHQLRAGRVIHAPGPYLRTALRHACARSRGQIMTGARNLSDHLDDLPALDDARLHVVMNDVLRALDDLPDAQRTLLLRVAEGETSPADLAREYHLPIGTIMSRLARARASLRKRLDLPPGSSFL